MSEIVIPKDFRLVSSISLVNGTLIEMYAGSLNITRKRGDNETQFTASVQTLTIVTKPDGTKKFNSN